MITLVFVAPLHADAVGACCGHMISTTDDAINTTTTPAAHSLFAAPQSRSGLVQSISSYGTGWRWCRTISPRLRLRGKRAGNSAHANRRGDYCARPDPTRPERNCASNGPRSPLTCCKLPCLAAPRPQRVLKPRARTSGMTSRRNHNRQPRMASKTNNCYRVCQVRDTTRVRADVSCCTQFNH